MRYHPVEVAQGSGGQQVVAGGGDAPGGAGLIVPENHPARSPETEKRPAPITSTSSTTHSWMIQTACGSGGGNPDTTLPDTILAGILRLDCGGFACAVSSACTGGDSRAIAWRSGHDEKREGCCPWFVADASAFAGNRQRFILSRVLGSV